LIKHVLFDFDGVILNSMPIRDWGFCKLFEEYPQEQINRLLEYHQQNGGLSRYVKIRYFFNHILNQEIPQDKVQDLADRFSTLVKERLCDPRLLINTTHLFIEKNFSNYNFHIVSGSDEKELLEVCDRLGISRFFVSIHGSPIPKDNLVAAIIRNNAYEPFETILVGDSINDYEAAVRNDIRFCGFNNPGLKDIGTAYINESMEELKFLIYELPEV
jgi:phosphoglycolate phosphatase-like HAD superfamily hydrolase